MAYGKNDAANLTLRDILNKVVSLKENLQRRNYPVVTFGYQPQIHDWTAERDNLLCYN